MTVDVVDAILRVVFIPDRRHLSMLTGDKETRTNGECRHSLTGGLRERFRAMLLVRSLPVATRYGCHFPIFHSQLALLPA